MYCLDEDLHCICKRCRSYNFVDSKYIQINDTGGVENYELISLKCSACGEQFIFKYSLCITTLNDFYSTQSFIGNIGFDLIEDISIIENPFYISKIRNVSHDVYNRIIGIINDISINPDLIRNVSRRDFEYIIAELVRRKGFKVEVTQQTRDGGRDIIAIKNMSGIPFKMFIECKHPEQGKSVGVEYIRSLYGVHNTNNGPNKSILVTSSYFSKEAEKFVKNETNSAWHLSLYDFDHLKKWLEDSY